MITITVPTALLDRQLKTQAAAHRAARRNRRAASQERKRRHRLPTQATSSTPHPHGVSRDEIVRGLRYDVWLHGSSARLRLREEAYAEMGTPRADIDLALTKLNLASQEVSYDEVWAGIPPHAMSVTVTA